LPPVDTSSITETCGNFSGWHAFSADELKRRYVSRATFGRRAMTYAEIAAKAGYLLPQDEKTVIAQATAELPDGFQ
jgi:hypothetical protein